MWEYYVRFAEAFFNEVHFHENVREIDFTEKKKEGQRIFFFFFDVVVVKMMMMKIKLTFSHENRGVRNPFFGIL